MYYHNRANLLNHIECVNFVEAWNTVYTVAAVYFRMASTLIAIE